MCGCEGLDDESAEDKLARVSTVLTRVINRLEEELRRERAAHERTLTSVLDQFEELFKDQRARPELAKSDISQPHTVVGHHMLALATKLQSEGQYDEAQRVKEKTYEMCTNAGIYFG